MSDCGSTMVQDHLRRIAEKHYDRRDRMLARITTRATLAERQEEVRGIYREILGPFPERTPLCVREAGVLAQSGYTIEKLIYETQPRLYVTAHLYRPEGPGPFPAVLSPVGHWNAGKAHEHCQALGAGLARSGCIALIYDAPGQGERLMYYDPLLGESQLGQRVIDEHSMMGHPCFLTGSHLAMHMIWDGMRGLDLLQQRPDVDPERIACTGTSGGGTLTQFITALDERVGVAVPVCSTGRVRVTSAGDAEQNMFGALRRGMCPTDLLWAAAPRPLLMITATEDAVFEGAQETLADVRRAYEIWGTPECVDHVEMEGEHGYIRDMRLAARRWLARWWDLPDVPREEEPVDLLPEETLRCTPTGQVTTSLGGETVFALNRRMARRVTPPRRPPHSREEALRLQQRVREHILRVTQYREPESAPPVEEHEVIESDGLHMTRLSYQSQADIRVPALLFHHNRSAPCPGLVLVHGAGKQAARDWVALLAREGFAVLAIDARGLGDTAPVAGEWDGWHPYRAFLLGSQAALARSALYVGPGLFTMRVLDVVQGISCLKARPEVDSHSVGVVGIGSGALMALYAGALRDDVCCVAAHRGLYAYRALTSSPFHCHGLGLFLPGVLEAYDLGDVAGLVAPRPLLLLDPVDEMDRPADERALQDEYGIARATYSTLDAADRLAIGRSDIGTPPAQALAAWVRGQKFNNGSIGATA